MTRRCTPEAIVPDRDAICAFAAVLFDECDGWVAVRQFPEKDGQTQRPRTPFFPVDPQLHERLIAEAVRATGMGLALYVVPGVVSGRGQAKAADVVAMRTVLVDLDEGDIAVKREHLCSHLGLPTLEVASGGVTASGQERLHLYWQLSETAFGQDLAVVCELRAAIAAKIGGDLSFASPHQPIRVAGSIYRKGGNERLVAIRHQRPLEYGLAEFAQKVSAMPPLACNADPIVEVAVKSKTPVGALLTKRVRSDGIDGVTRFEALSSVIGYWIRRHREGHVSWEAAWQEICAYNEARIDPPWPLDRLREETERLGRRDKEAFVAAPDLTEDAVALEFTTRYGDDLRYVACWGQWLLWEGTRWERERTLKVCDLARLVCRASAARCESPRQRSKLASAGTVAAVERLARADRRHAATPDIWDADPWLLNTPAGVVDLRTGALASHRRTDWHTRITTAAPDGDCPVWREFLATVTAHDAELQAYLQRVAGYCLTGVTSEHALFFLHGTGANGKSVFINTLAAVLGEYAAVAAMDMFMATNGDRHPTDMAGLRGARLVTATETEQGRRWAESRLKTLTGGDRITARFMRQDFFEFVPQFKLIIAGNHKPAIRNVDEAMRRRLHMVPFTVTIPPGQRDTRLGDRLLAERDGILGWAVAGCLEWQRCGLTPPVSVVAATEEYFEGEDALGRWLEEACERDVNASETSAALFARWKCWADANGEFAGSAKWFSESLINRGFEPKRDRRARGFRGLRLREDSQDTIGMDFEQPRSSG